MNGKVFINSICGKCAHVDVCSITFKDNVQKCGFYLEERPHGTWIECEEMNCRSDIEKIYICPFCKMKHHRKYDFCNCGADMRKEGEAE